MADNTTLNSGSGGDVIATDDVTTLNGAASSGVKVQRMKPMFGDNNDATDVSLNAPFPIRPAAAYFIFGTGNSSTSQLGAGATFTGAIEDVLSQPAASILITADQPITLTINQYIDASGTFKASTWTYTLTANQQFARSFTLNGNYFNLTVQNTGASATTTLNINTYYGTIATAGAAPQQASMPVTVATDQTPIPTKLTDGTNTIAIDPINSDGISTAEFALPTEGYLHLFNGTTWDRARGTIANGLEVDVTRMTPDGTNVMPSMDVAARRAYMQITDGTASVVVDNTPADAEAAATAALVVNARMKGLNSAGTNDRIRANTTNFKCATYTTAQTGVALWTPAAGKAICVTSIQIQSYGTTAGTAQVWFGAAADTAYTRGTDAPVFDGEFAPSATNKPGFAMAFPTPIRGAADFVLRVTTTGAQSITVNVWGYEI